jgi:integrase
MLLALARRAVALAEPVERLNSLSALLSPALVERCLETYSPADLPNSTAYAADLARLLVSIARATKCLGAEDINQLDEMRAALDQDRGIRLTEKNAKLILQVLSPGVWRRVRDLPPDLMLKARAMRDRSPTKAAVLAQMAVAIALLTVAPVRLSNLASIQLDINLQRLGGPRSPYRLVFPEYDVKNRIHLEFQLDSRVADLIDEYLHDHLHVLRRGSNELFLFPGETCSHKGGATLSAQITQRVVKATGLRITVHQFRHAAGALLLHAQPGNYELVRRALGHKNIKTTTDFYTHLQSLQATRILSDIVYGELDFESLPM